MKTRLFFLCTAFSFMYAAAAAQTVAVSAAILQAATVTLPERIQKIYIADRTGTEYAEYTGTYSWRTQLKLYIESTGRYSAHLAETDSVASGTAAGTRAPLPWKEVNRITAHDTAALLIVLEQLSLAPADGSSPENRVWRIYDVATQTLLDEFSQQVIPAWGTTGNAEAVQLYSERILMHWEWVQREYYKGGNARMKAAWRCIEESNWEAATAYWKAVAGDSLINPKTAAKACYNMALYCELENDLPGAYQWIARSQRMGNVLAAYYGKILRARTGEIPLLGEQVAQKQGQIPLGEFENSIAHSRTSPSKLSGNPNFLERKRPLTAEELERRRMHENPPISTGTMTR